MRTQRLCRRFVRAVGRLVPPERRPDFVAEWDGELLARRRPPADLLRTAGGALPDALTLLFETWSPEMLGHDLRFALRSLVRRPAFTALAIAVLAVGLGVTVAMLAVVERVALRPPPYAEPERLVALWEKSSEKGWDRNQAAPANFLDWRRRCRALSDVAATGTSSYGLILGGEAPVPVDVLDVTPNLLSVLGVEPQLGRGFREEELWATGESVVLVSDALWHRRLGGDPEVVGQTITLHGRPATVVGVLPPGFAYGPAADLWAPFGWDPLYRDEVWFRRAHFLWPIARLAPGATVETARRELAAIAAELAVDHPETNRSMGAGLTPLGEWQLGETGAALALLLAGVAALLLLACANVAGLLFVRAYGRRREMALRSALGAPGWRLVRQLLVESLLIATAAGAAGLGLATLGLRVLGSLAPAGVLPAEGVPLSPPAVAAAVGLTLAATLVAGLSPALAGTRADLRGGLGGSRIAGEGRERRLGRWLVVGEVALAASLMTGAGLVVHGVATLLARGPGFAAAQVTVVEVALPSLTYGEAGRADAFYAMLEERAARLPGVRAAATATRLPFVGGSWTNDYSLDDGQQGFEIQHREVSSGYFATLGVPLVAGRLLDGGDRSGAPPVVVVNETLARRHFGEPAKAVGRRIVFSRQPTAEDPRYEIVGVVADVRDGGLALPPRPEAHFSILQEPDRGRYLLLRTTGDPRPAVDALQALFHELDPALVPMAVESLAAVVDGSASRERLTSVLLAVFAAIALLLAAAGTYGALAAAVGRRVPEIAVRMSLGASSSSVLRAVVTEGLALTLAGGAIGVAIALAALRWLGDRLSGVGAVHLPTLAVTAAVLLAAGLAAAWVPALRASRVDPMTVLRAE